MSQHPPMPSLLDVVAQRGAVQIRGVRLPVDGLSIEAIAGLVARFEALRALLGGGEAVVTVATLLEAGPPVVAAIIAAGLGHAGDPAHEQAAARLSIDEQIRVLSEVVARTFPDGFPNLVGRLQGLAKAAGLEEEATSRLAGRVVEPDPAVPAPPPDSSAS